jgi:hypothetical protein
MDHSAKRGEKAGEAYASVAPTDAASASPTTTARAPGGAHGGDAGSALERNFSFLSALGMAFAMLNVRPLNPRFFSRGFVLTGFCAWLVELDCDVCGVLVCVSREGVLTLFCGALAGRHRT